MLLFSCSVVSESLWPHGLQHTRLHGPSLSPGVCSNSDPLSWWCHPTTSSSVVPFSSCLQFILLSGFFSSELALCIRWPKYWSFNFSISPSNEYSRLISFKTAWYDLPIQGTLAPQFESINSFTLSLLYGPSLTSLHDYWKNHSFNNTDLCWQSDVAAL